LCKYLSVAKKLAVIINRKYAFLSNGITMMRDPRVFHIEDNNWFKKYQDQVTFEVDNSNAAWTEGGPELVIEEAQQRLRKEGWDSLRPALSVTIRFVYL
jgi:hypothetical protein